MIRASTRSPEHPVPAGGPPEAQHVIAAGQGIQQVPHPRGRDRQRPALAHRRSRGQDSGRPARRPGAAADGLEELQFGVVVREPMCSISRDPRREEYTICTALAPDAVFTVRTYGTGPLYGPD